MAEWRIVSRPGTFSWTYHPQIKRHFLWWSWWMDTGPFLGYDTMKEAQAAVDREEAGSQVVSWRSSDGTSTD